MCSRSSDKGKQQVFGINSLEACIWKVYIASTNTLHRYFFSMVLQMATQLNDTTTWHTIEYSYDIVNACYKVASMSLWTSTWTDRLLSINHLLYYLVLVILETPLLHYNC